MICGVTMDMDLTTKDEAFAIVAGSEALEKAKVAMGRA